MQPCKFRNWPDLIWLLVIALILFYVLGYVVCLQHFKPNKPWNKVASQQLDIVLRAVGTMAATLVLFNSQAAKVLANPRLHPVVELFPVVKLSQVIMIWKCLIEHQNIWVINVLKSVAINKSKIFAAGGQYFYLRSDILWLQQLLSISYPGSAIAWCNFVIEYSGLASVAELKWFWVTESVEGEC